MKRFGVVDRKSDGRKIRKDIVRADERFQVTSRMYQKLVEKLAGSPEERILNYLMLRSLKQARYSAINAGHFALAAKSYTHFTSPIRRYPDLIVHRILKQVLVEEAEEIRSAAHGDVAVGKGTGDQKAVSVPRPAQLRRLPDTPSPWSKRRVENGREGRRAGAATPEASDEAPIPVAELHSIAEESSEAERRADDAERELMEWKKTKFMAERIGQEFEGLIVSVTKFGFSSS